MQMPFRTIAVVLATTGLCWPQVATAAQPPFVGAGGSNPALFVQDVELGSDGELDIQVVDSQGKPFAGTPLIIRQAAASPAVKTPRAVRHEVSGKDGQIVVPRLTPGLYEITSGSLGGIYRLWAPRTAPPKASNGILLINAGGVVRGAGGGWQKATLVGGVIITSGVVGGVIGYNLKDAS